MHQPRPGAHAPKRRRSYLEARGLWPVLDNAVARANVMQKEIAEGSNNLEAEMIVRRQRSTINYSSGLAVRIAGT